MNVLRVFGQTPREPRETLRDFVLSVEPIFDEASTTNTPCLRPVLPVNEVFIPSSTRHSTHTHHSVQTFVRIRRDPVLLSWCKNKCQHASRQDYILCRVSHHQYTVWIQVPQQSRGTGASFHETIVIVAISHHCGNCDSTYDSCSIRLRRLHNTGTTCLRHTCNN